MYIVDYLYEIVSNSYTFDDCMISLKIILNEFEFEIEYINKNKFEDFYIQVFKYYTILDSNNMQSDINLIKKLTNFKNFEYKLYENYNVIINSFKLNTNKIFRSINDIDVTKATYKKALYHYINMVLFINGFYKINDINIDELIKYYESNQTSIIQDMLNILKTWVLKDTNKQNDIEIIEDITNMVKYLNLTKSQIEQFNDIISYRTK